MAGAYCRFCNTRCFVYRQVIVGDESVWSGHMATCQRGKEHDRAELGVDADCAHNPAFSGEMVNRVGGGPIRTDEGRGGWP